ncbi:hypothetical protein [Nocardia jejuensis]|uniref:hypothetical protein n=1 Tax=Nocardia jejuensis TaxID=328049 RepID=UPI0012FB1EE6|nr:hypothetical protein [Nocardia jejuensis]
MSKHHDPNFEFGIVMPPGTPAITDDILEPGEPEVKSTAPPAADMLPIHWNAPSKCYWVPRDELVYELESDVQEWAEHIRAQYLRNRLRLVSKRVRKPTVAVTVDEDLKQKVEKALLAVDSNHRDHLLGFLRWLVRETDELPARPDYPIPHIPYGE